MKAINEFKRLIKTRSDPSFWTQNIIDAHELCKSKNDHKHFWGFLTNPHGYDPTKIADMRTLGDRMDDPDYKCGIKPLPDELTQDIYKNGNEIIIRTRRKDTAAIDDEKCPVECEEKTLCV
jgi:hypothetical protein